MSIRNRTTEFFQTIESVISRSSNAYDQQQRLLSQSPGPHVPSTRTEFARMAATIGKDITTMLNKLQNLALLAKRQTLFDDKPVEINELMYIIKQDINKVNKHIGGLQSFTMHQKQVGAIKGRQFADHTSGVITSLQTRLASTSQEFKSILEIREQNLMEAKSRKDQYTAGSSAVSSSALAQSSLVDSPLFNPSRRANNNAMHETPELVIDMGSSSLAAQQSLSLLSAPQSTSINSQIIDSRATAIESIESTIAELGQIYQNFATILSTQRETIQVIEGNVVDVEMNVGGAQDQLFRFYQNLSGNRMLMIKLFAVIILTFFVFMVVM